MRFIQNYICCLVITLQYSLQTAMSIILTPKQISTIRTWAQQTHQYIASIICYNRYLFCKWGKRSYKLDLEICNPDQNVSTTVCVRTRERVGVGVFDYSSWAWYWTFLNSFQYSCIWIHEEPTAHMCTVCDIEHIPFFSIHIHAKFEIKHPNCMVSICMA